MATMPTRADVWLVDLGMVATVRPCVGAVGRFSVLAAGRQGSRDPVGGRH